MLERGKMDRGVIEIVDTESLVPKGHLLRKIDEAVDFNRLYEIDKARLRKKSRFVDQYIPSGYNQSYSSWRTLSAASRKRCTVGLGSGECRIP